MKTSSRNFSLLSNCDNTPSPDFRNVNIVAAGPLTEQQTVLTPALPDLGDIIGFPIFY